MARFVPGGSNVVCVEPNAMLGEVFDMKRTRLPAKQLAINILEKSSSSCVAHMKESKKKYEMVITLEVLEHIDEKYHDVVVDFLARNTGKFLIFSASRLGQKGMKLIR